MIRALTADEVATAEFAHLLWLAVEVGDDELDRIRRDELSRLTVAGIVEQGDVLAFIAYATDDDQVTIEYIAVNPGARGRGYGTELVEAARDGGRAVHAQTDDDAVDFYRRIGFEVTLTAPDARWPQRQRYNCSLAAR